MMVVTVVWISGYCFFYLAFYVKSSTIGFSISLFATLLIGVFSSLGNVTAVGFMKAFPAEVVVGFSSGTGLAGIAGVGIVMLASLLQIAFEWVCIDNSDLHLPHPSERRVLLHLSTDTHHESRGGQKGPGRAGLADDRGSDRKAARS
jgi:hypothetical protein